MNRLQKIAWFNLKVLGVGGSVSLLIIAVSLAAGELIWIGSCKQSSKRISRVS